jgi:acyl-CoA thioester hydrolase
MGVVYHANYLAWCEVGRTEYMRARGATYAALERGGLSLMVTGATLRYHSSARYDDVVRIETTLTELKSRSITFDYLISLADTGKRVVSASTTLVSVAVGGGIIALPETVRAQLLRETE